MAPLLIALGAALLALVTVDQFATIAATGPGDGILVHRINEVLWRLALWTHRRWPSHRRLAAVGVGLLVLVPLVWIAGLWLGWSLIFSATEGAVVDGTTKEPASLLGRVYFAGFSLFTLGLGDLHPGGDGWRIATVSASIMGLAMITLSITYLVPVVQSATERRSLARSLQQFELLQTDSGTGDVADSVRLSELGDLTSDINVSCEQHLTHRVLRYYHASRDQYSLAVQVCALNHYLGTLEAPDAESRLRLHRLTGAAMDLARAMVKPERGDDDETDDREALLSLLEFDGRSEYAETVGVGDRRTAGDEPSS